MARKANYIDRKERTEPQNYLNRGDGDSVETPGKQESGEFVGFGSSKTNAANTGASRTDENELPSDAQKGFTPLTRPQLPKPQLDLSQPDNRSAEISEAVKNGSYNSPLAQKLRQIQMQRMAAQTMPSYVNKKGETVQGMKDENGRAKSGLRALVEGLATYFDPRTGVARDWTDFAARMSGAGGRAVGGLINPAWDEYADRDKLIARLTEEEASLMKAVEFESKMQTAEVGRQDKFADNKRLDDQQKDRQINAERNQLIRQIGQMKRYKRGENPDFDAKLDAAELEQPDFEPDKKIRPRFWDGKTGKYMTFDDYGRAIPVIDAEGNEVSDDRRKTVYEDGLAVSSRDALQSRTQANVSQINAANQTNDDNERYEGKKAEISAKIAGINANIKKKQERLNAIPNPPQGLEDYQKREKIENEIDDLESKLAEQQTLLKSVPKPKPTQARNNPQITYYTENDVVERLRKANGGAEPTEEQKAEAIKQARAKGIIRTPNQ